MKPDWESEGVQLYCGDSLEILPLLPEGSVDAVVTDSPYGLKFMGKTWDHSVPGVPFWAAGLRVAKPGAHLLAFGGTRTFHRLACAIEDAGWEIRDTVCWLYGSGFPKSLDVSKAIDKRGGAQVGWFGAWLRQWRVERGITQKEVAALFPSKTGGRTGCVANWELGFNMPTPEQFNRICQAFDLPFNSIEEAEREVVGQKSWMSSANPFVPGANHKERLQLDITAPSTDAAKEWEGWGTALKPAWEPVIVARKPLEGTVAENVLKHGTGGINVHGCRIGTSDVITQTGEVVDMPRDSCHPGYDRPGATMFRTGKPKERAGPANPSGRWPANVAHDGSEEVIALCPPETGKSSGTQRTTSPGWFGQRTKAEDKPVGFQDTGSAARFFYCAKASRAEREAGLAALIPHSRGDVTGRKDDSAGQNHPRACVRAQGAIRNTHPTVKPVALMRWLVRLVTPPGGIVLDPFCGTASTGIACIREGFRFLGIEIERRYFDIACHRIEAAQKGLKPQSVAAGQKTLWTAGKDKA